MNNQYDLPNDELQEVVKYTILDLLFPYGYRMYLFPYGYRMYQYDLSNDELYEIVVYTIQKIERYPKSFGKTVENYFDLLFPDEVKNYLIGREINRRCDEILERKKSMVTTSC